MLLQGSRMKAVLLCAIVGALISTRPTLAAFLQVPDPLNVTAGGVAEFYCRADGTAVFWTINGVSVNQLDDLNISPDVGPAVNGFRTEILRIMADVQYNNSVIQCVSFTSGEGETASDPAPLKVQGLLSAPTNMQTTHPNSSAILLCWDPPFTLDITDVDPDIPGYTVSITNNNTKVTSERNVTKPEFIFQEEGYDPCHVYLFRVRAWNPIGMGEPSDKMEECFGEAPQSASVDCAMRDSGSIYLIITYNMSCHGSRPESINITMDNGSQIQMDPPTSGRLDFPVDKVSNVTVTVMNQFGYAHTEVMFEDCQLRGTEDESSQGNNLVIPVVASVCGTVVVGLVTFLIVLIFKKKFRRECQDDFATKDNEYTDVPTKVIVVHNPERQASSSSADCSSADSQSPLMSSSVVTDSQEKSELQYVEIQISQQQQPHQQAPPTSQPVAYAQLQQQDTKASDEHESSSI